jgi:hypothetical protein
MTWKTWAAALSLGAAFTAAAPPAIAFDRGDGSAASTVKTDKSVDILDLYAWMEPTSGNRVYLLMTAFPGADKMNDRFSSQNAYVFHTNARQVWNDASPDAEVTLICKFDQATPTQGFECWAGQTEYVKGKVNATGQSSRSGALTVFAGPRNDPFFMNDTALTNAMTVGAGSIQSVYNGIATKDAAKCAAFSAAQSTAVRAALNPTGSMDSFKGQNALAIVVSIDPAILMPGSKKVLSVWGSTNKLQ